MSQRTGFAGCQSRLTTTAALSLVPLRYRDTGGDRHLDPGERSHVSHGCTRRTGTIDHTAQECRAHLNAPGRCLALVSYVIFYDTFMIPIVLITVKRIAELCIITIIYKEIVLRDIYMHHDMESGTSQNRFGRSIDATPPQSLKRKLSNDSDIDNDDADSRLRTGRNAIVSLSVTECCHGSHYRTPTDILQP